MFCFVSAYYDISFLDIFFPTKFTLTHILKSIDYFQLFFACVLTDNTQIAMLDRVEHFAFYLYCLKQTKHINGT